jgi:hypothetical protein
VIRKLLAPQLKLRECFLPPLRLERFDNLALQLLGVEFHDLLRIPRHFAISLVCGDLEGWAFETRNALLASVCQVPPFALSPARSGWQGDDDNAKSGTGVVEAVSRF